MTWALSISAGLGALSFLGIMVNVRSGARTAARKDWHEQYWQAEQRLFGDDGPKAINAARFMQYLRYAHWRYDDEQQDIAKQSLDQYWRVMDNEVKDEEEVSDDHS